MAAAIRRVCGRRHHALVPDVQQELYLALWKRLQSGKEIEHPTSYLYKAALTTALAMVRKLESESGSTGPVDADRAADTAAADGPGVEPSRLLAELIETLGDEEARAVRAYLAGFNHKEIAQLYGWTESVARHRIYRSIQELRDKVKEVSG